MAQQCHVIDRVSAGDHSRDQARDIQVRVDAFGLADPHVFGDQLSEPGPLGQPQHRRQTGARLEVRVIELGGEVMTHSHLTDALLRGRISP